MNAFEIIRRDLELNSYTDDPIQDNPQISNLTGGTYSRKFLSVAVIISCGQNKLDHPDAMQGGNAVNEIWAKRAQRFTLPEDDPHLLGWAYHIHTLGLQQQQQQQQGKTFNTIKELSRILEGTVVDGFFQYIQGGDLKTDKDLIGVKDNVEFRLRMKAFLAKWSVNTQMDRMITVQRLLNYILLWNSVIAAK